MTLDEKLDSLRSIMQQDIGARGLSGEMFAACAGDLAAACRDLAGATSVGIATGFFIPGPDRYESDGPPGADFLGRCLTACGIPWWLHDSILPNPPRQVEDVSPRIAPAGVSHVVAIERPGPAADGRCHTMRGIDITDRTSDLQPLLEGARTIGIGDGGNEIGMGKLPPGMIARNIANSAKIACVVATDHLLVSGISNWGAWALGIGVCLVRGVVPPISIDHERRTLQAMVEAGLVDGVTGRPELSVDGVQFDPYFQPLIQMKKAAEA